MKVQIAYNPHPGSFTVRRYVDGSAKADARCIAVNPLRAASAAARFLGCSVQGQDRLRELAAEVKAAGAQNRVLEWDSDHVMKIGKGEQGVPERSDGSILSPGETLHRYDHPAEVGFGAFILDEHGDATGFVDSSGRRIAVDAPEFQPAEVGGGLRHPPLDVEFRPGAVSGPQSSSGESAPPAAEEEREAPFESAPYDEERSGEDDTGPEAPAQA